MIAQLTLFIEWINLDILPTLNPAKDALARQLILMARGDLIAERERLKNQDYRWENLAKCITGESR